MDRKIALEEHFAIRDTLGFSEQYARGGAWSTLESRLLDVAELRLGPMDEYGIEMALVSLNSPAVQAIPDPARAIDVARRANDALAAAVAKRSDRFAAF